MEAINRTQSDVLILTDYKKSKSLNWFWLGFIVYMLGLILASATNKYVICQSIQLLGLLIFVKASITLIRFDIYNIYLKFFYVLYCTWLLIVMARGFHLDVASLKSMLFDPGLGIFLYLSPLILLFPQTFDSYKKVFDVIFIYSIIYIVLNIIFIKELRNSDRTDVTGKGLVEIFSDLSVPSCFILLTYRYHPKKRKLFALLVLALTLFFAIFWARRGLIFVCLTPIVLSFILHLFTSRRKLSLFLLSGVIIFSGLIYGKGIFKQNQNQNGLFSYLIERGTEDTRTVVEVYFYKDMSPKDWLIGRGINGEYFCPDIEEDDVTGYRNVIETGYLQIILNGGIISLGLYLLIAVPAAIKGMFYSKNVLSIAAGIWIFLAIINLYPTRVNGFSLDFLIVWISIGICYSKKIRNMSDSAIKDYFNDKYQIT